MLKRTYNPLYDVDVEEVLSISRDIDEKSYEDIENKLVLLGSRTSVDYYNRYGVDNDFDLAEAMYEDYSSYTGNLIREPKFIEFRIQCAMNPEYTEKCLESRAFRDVKDDILRKLGDA